MFNRRFQLPGNGYHHFLYGLLARICNNFYFGEGYLREQRRLHFTVGKRAAQQDDADDDRNGIFIGDKEIAHGRI